MTENPEQQQSTNMDKIRASLAIARDLTLSISDAEARLSADRAALNALKHQVLPDLFNQEGIRDEITLEGRGNVPTYKCSLKNYYKAVIPAKWDESKRTAALEELDRLGAGDLAQRTVTVTFPRSDEEGCEAFCQDLGERGIPFKFSFDVHWSTLTSWLRETVEEGIMPDLEKIGGQVGQVVELKPQED